MKITELMEKYFKDAIESDPKIIDEINVIIEAKVSKEVISKLASKEKEIQEFKNAIVEKIDEYIRCSVEEFVKEHKVGIESDDVKVALAIDMKGAACDALIDFDNSISHNKCFSN